VCNDVGFESRVICRGVRACKNGSCSAELQTVAATLLQTVRNLYIAYSSGPSLLGLEEPFFPEWAGILAWNSTSLFTIHR
jgi:hypothetical protein